MRLFGFNATALTIFAFGASIASAVAGETVLYSFPDAKLGNPIGRLTLRNGSLLGTGSGFTAGGNGQVFALSQSGGSWTLKTLLAFNGTNGAIPRGGLIEDSTGALYGTTSSGGAYLYYGNVFRLAKSGGSWTGATVWDFGGTGGDGRDPECDLIMDGTGALYGTTILGGTNNGGILFRLTQSGGVWKERVLYRFASTGYEPVAGPIMSKGMLYGTTYSGGNVAFGTVFALARSGGVWNESTIHNFGGGADGEYPIAGLVEGPHGTLYGTTLFAGKYHFGTAFALTQSHGTWTKTVLHDFGSGRDGSELYGGLLRVGNILYGAAEYGGAHGSGMLFSLSESGGVWNEAVLHDFGAGKDGANPTAAVIADAKGNLFGTTFQGGAEGNGTVWEFTP